MMEQESDNRIPMHPWSPGGGPRTAEHRAMAKQWFLEELSRCHTVTLACEFAGIVPDTAYRWKEKDKTFAATWDVTVERSHDIARASIYQRGILGWDERVTSNGQAVYDYEPILNDAGTQLCDEKGKPLWKRGAPLTVHKWSDSLAALYARANLPEYKEKQQIDLHAQITNMAETAKEELLTDLAAAIAHENKEQSQQEEPLS